MGIPAAVAAALRHTDRTVFCFCGDGGFLMNGNEFITACERKLNVKVFVSNNRSYGTIRSYQQRSFPDRPSGTALYNPDFVAMARAFGARGFNIDSVNTIASTVGEMVRSNGPALAEIRCDVDLSVAMSLAEQRLDG